MGSMFTTAKFRLTMAISPKKAVAPERAASPDACAIPIGLCSDFGDIFRSTIPRRNS